MKAAELMARDVRTCSKDDSLEQAARIMWESDLGCLVVTDPEERPVGIITDRVITWLLTLREHVYRMLASTVRWRTM